MFGFLTRVISMILGSVCISVIPLLFFLATRRRRNGGLLRRTLLASYRLYAGLFNWVQPIILKEFGLDILGVLPRTLIAGVLSFGIGWGILALFHFHLNFWLALVFATHGIFVGWQWEMIESPQDFQMGVRLE